MCVDFILGVYDSSFQLPCIDSFIGTVRSLLYVWRCPTGNYPRPVGVVGYHVRLTRERSAVRTCYRTIFILFFICEPTWAEGQCESGSAFPQLCFFCILSTWGDASWSWLRPGEVSHRSEKCGGVGALANRRHAMLPKTFATTFLGDNFGTDSRTMISPVLLPNSIRFRMAS